MLLRNYLLRLMAPEKDRWKPMLAGLALFAAGAGAAVLVQPSPISIVLAFLAVAAWFMGAFCMVGYLRWYFASELSRVQQDNADQAGKNKE